MNSEAYYPYMTITHSCLFYRYNAHERLFSIQRPFQNLLSPMTVGRIIKALKTTASWLSKFAHFFSAQTLHIRESIYTSTFTFHYLDSSLTRGSWISASIVASKPLLELLSNSSRHRLTHPSRTEIGTGRRSVGTLMSPPATAALSFVLLIALLLLMSGAPIGTESLAVRERKRRQTSAVAPEAAPAAALTSTHPLYAETANAFATATPLLTSLPSSPAAAADGTSQPEARPLRRSFARRPLHRIRSGRSRGAQHIANQRPSPHTSLPLGDPLQPQPELPPVPRGANVGTAFARSRHRLIMLHCLCEWGHRDWTPCNWRWALKKRSSLQRPSFRTRNTGDGYCNRIVFVCGTGDWRQQHAEARRRQQQRLRELGLTSTARAGERAQSGVRSRAELLLERLRASVQPMFVYDELLAESAPSASSGDSAAAREALDHRVLDDLFENFDLNRMLPEYVHVPVLVQKH